MSDVKRPKTLAETLKELGHAFRALDVELARPIVRVLDQLTSRPRMRD